MNELTDEQIKGIFLNAGYVTQWSTKDIHPISYRAARDLIAADRARRQAEQEPAAAIAALERIAGDLQALCDKQALMLGERDAQLEAVGAGGVGAMMPKQLAVECDGDWSAAYQPPALQRAERQPLTMDQVDDLLQNRKLHGGVLIDLVCDVEKHHGIVKA